MAMRAATATQVCSTEWISKSWNGQPAAGNSFDSALSSDGRHVAFESEAANLVPGDSNGKNDIFVVDRFFHTVERVSVSSAGVQGNDHSLSPSMSGDGRYITFVSKSTNLDPLDTHPAYDVYLHDRQAKTTQLISIHIKPQVTTFWASAQPRISPDGRFVLFHHGEDNIVPGNANGTGDVFLRDMSTGVTELVSVSSAGLQSDGQSYGGVMSADARYVAFLSEANNWYPGNSTVVPRPCPYIRDRVSGTTLPVNPTNMLTLCGASDGLSMSVDGRFLAYTFGNCAASDLTPLWLAHVFVRDMLTGVSVPVSHSTFAIPTLPKPSLLPSGRPSISADGRFITFQSYDDDLVLNSGNTGGINVFVHDRLTGLTQCASLGPAGQWPSIPFQWYAEAFRPAISADGRHISFSCEDPSFGSGNALYNIYVRTCDWTQPAVYCAAQTNSLGCVPSISSAGSPSASVGSGFTVGVKRLISSTYGVFFYSTRRPLLAPFQGGYLCMELPIRRLALMPTGGSTSPDCTGGLQVDFNAWIASGADPSLVAGENVCIQAWSRDAGAVTTTNLSNALVFAIGP